LLVPATNCIFRFGEIEEHGKDGKSVENWVVQWVVYSVGQMGLSRADHWDEHWAEWSEHSKVVCWAEKMVDYSVAPMVFWRVDWKVVDWVERWVVWTDAKWVKTKKRKSDSSSALQLAKDPHHDERSSHRRNKYSPEYPPRFPEGR
jgi:hypothetical protein